MILIKQGKTNLKYLLIVVVLAIIAGGWILWCAMKQGTSFAQLPEMKSPEIKIPNTPIIYLKMERIDNLFSYNVLYSFNPATKNKQSIVKEIDEKITEGYKYYSIASYSLSFDKKMVAYVLEPLGGHPKTPLRIFNLITGEDKLLHIFTQNPSLEIIGWSSDDKYLALRWKEQSGGSLSLIKIINSITGEEELSLEEPRDYYFEIKWLNNENLIYNQIQTVLKKEGNEKNLEGIKVINVKGGQKFLQQATELKDYYIMKILDDGRILFSLEEIKSSGDWWVRPIPSEETYWIMDQEGKNLTQILKNEAMDLIKEPDMEVLLSGELLSGYLPSVFYQKQLSKDRNWWLFTVVQGCPTDAIKCFPPNDIFIINVEDKTSLIKIDENVRILDPDW